MLIYLITNNINGKVYVGKLAHRKTLWNYWSENVAKAMKGRKTKPYLYSAIRKHKAENFSIHEIDSANTHDELCLLEIKWIKEYNANDPTKGYNLTTGGEGNPGHTVSAKHRAALSAAHKGKPLSLEHRTKLSQAKLQNPVKYWLGRTRVSPTKGRKRVVIDGHIQYRKEEM